MRVGTSAHGSTGGWKRRSSNNNASSGQIPFTPEGGGALQVMHAGRAMSMARAVSPLGFLREVEVGEFALDGARSVRRILFESGHSVYRGRAFAPVVVHLPICSDCLVVRFWLCLKEHCCLVDRPIPAHLSLGLSRLDLNLIIVNVPSLQHERRYLG